VEIEIRKGKVYAQRECERERMWGREEIWRNSKESFQFDAYFLPYGNV